MDLKTKLSEIVGSENVDDSRETLNVFSRDHSLMTVGGLADIVVRPDTGEQVQKIIELANSMKVAVIPVSSSMHFHGNTLPKMGGIVLDTRRMNRIFTIDKLERLARIEPGVTWTQIQNELAAQQQRMIMPLMPPGSSSVVTSLAERQVPTNTRYEFAEPMCSTEVVWGNGMRFRTGSASAPGFPEKSVCKGGNPEGPGTDFYRFFQGAEGTMGVLTWAVVKFEYLPVKDKVYFIPFDRLSDAIEPLYRILRRMIGNECFLIDNQVGSLIFGDRWPEDYRRLRKLLPPYLLVLVLSGPPRLPEEKMAYEKEALDEITSQVPSIKRILTSLPGVVGLENRLPNMVRKPWPEDRVYWKHLMKGGCQDLFFITRMEEVPRFTEMVTNVAGSHGYDVAEMGAYLQPLEQGRACQMEYQFYYDPDDENEKAKVKALYLKAAHLLFKEGAFFSRPTGLLSSMVYERAGGYANTIKKIKGVLDPNYIMCPGNACF